MECLFNEKAITNSVINNQLNDKTKHFNLMPLFQNSLIPNAGYLTNEN